MPSEPFNIPTADDPASRMVRVETKLDVILSQLAGHEPRIRKVESAIAALWGGGGLLAGIVATFGVLVTVWTQTR